MSMYVTCIPCGGTVKGFYGKPHPFTDWCKCDDKTTGRTKEKPYANTAGRSYGKGFDFSKVDPNNVNEVEKKLITDFYMWMVENDHDHNIRARVENKAELFLGKILNKNKRKGIL